jgi:copper(I)-binding protein
MPREGTVVARNARLARIRLIPAVGAALALILSGCAAGQISQTAMQVAAVDGANGTAGPVGIRNVRFAPTENGSYPAGADLPVKLWVSNAANTADTLTAVSTPAAAKVEISGNADFAPQTLVEISDSTEVKITVSGLSAALPYGHSIPMTFTFQQAGAVTVNVPIEIPAARETEARDTVNVLPAEPGNIWFGEEGGATQSEH